MKIERLITLINLEFELIDNIKKLILKYLDDSDIYFHAEVLNLIHSIMVSSETIEIYARVLRDTLNERSENKSLNTILFASKFIENQKPLDRETGKILYEHFEELL